MPARWIRKALRSSFCAFIGFRGNSEGFVRSQQMESLYTDSSRNVSGLHQECTAVYCGLVLNAQSNPINLQHKLYLFCFLDVVVVVVND